MRLWSGWLAAPLGLCDYLDCQHPTMRRAIQKILLAPAGASIHVHNDDVAQRERWQQDLRDIGLETRAVNWTIQNARSLDPIAA